MLFGGGNGTHGRDCQFLLLACHTVVYVHIFISHSAAYKHGHTGCKFDISIESVIKQAIKSTSQRWKFPLKHRLKCQHILAFREKQSARRCEWGPPPKGKKLQLMQAINRLS